VASHRIALSVPVSLLYVIFPLHASSSLSVDSAHFARIPTSVEHHVPATTLMVLPPNLHATDIRLYGQGDE